MKVNFFLVVFSAACFAGPASAQNLVRVEDAPANLASASPPAWSGAVLANAALSDVLKSNYNLDLSRPAQAAAFDRIMAKTSLGASEFAADQDSQIAIKRIKTALTPVAYEALARTLRLNASAPTADAVDQIRALAPELLDLSVMTDFLENTPKRQVILGNHWAQAVLIRANAERAAAQARLDWGETEADVAGPSTFVAALSSDLNQSGLEAVSALSRGLYDSHRIVRTLEEANPQRAHEHVLKAFQHVGGPAVSSWLDFLRAHTGSNSNPGVWGASRIPQRDGGLFSLAEDILPHWKPNRGNWDEEKAVRAPEQGNLRLQLLQYALQAGEVGAAEWGRLETFLFQRLRSGQARDDLRAALQFLGMRRKGAVPDELWKRMLEEPPKNKSERAALRDVVVLWANASAPFGFEEALALPGRLDYEFLYRSALRRLVSRFFDAIKLTKLDRARVALNPLFMRALIANDLVENLASLASFTKKKGPGLASIRRLVMELSRSQVLPDGSLRYSRRYRELRGKFPDEILNRWIENYDQPWGDPPAPAAPIDWSSYAALLRASLRIGKPEEVLEFTPSVKAAAKNWKRRYKQEYGKEGDHYDHLLIGLQEEFLPRLLQILERLEANREPPPDAVRVVMPILGKQQWLRDVLPDGRQTLALMRRMLREAAASKPGRKTPPSDLELLHVTDDPATMIKLGEEPVSGCQTCKEPMDYNLNGEPVNKLLLGQIKLANWNRGGRLIARTLLEIGFDDLGRPALFVESLKHDSGDEKRMQEAVVDYARHLGVASVYFSPYGDSRSYWNVRGLKKRSYTLFDQQGLALRRDGIGDDSFNLHKKEDTAAMDLIPRPGEESSDGPRPTPKPRGRWQRFLDKILPWR